jgi:calcineurin-like phosphoesterase family protein
LSRAYVIADLHLGHRKLQEVRGVGDDLIVERWNSVVTKRDVVYILGDVFKLDRLPEMRGIKKLAMGNHDLAPMARYLEHFTQVRAMYQWDGCLLTHIPVHPNQRHRWRLNIHGHLHEHRLSDDPFYRCVSAEQVDYTPILLSTACAPWVTR